MSRPSKQEFHEMLHERSCRVCEFWNICMMAVRVRCVLFLLGKDVVYVLGCGGGSCGQGGALAELCAERLQHTASNQPHRLCQVAFQPALLDVSVVMEVE